MLKPKQVKCLEIMLEKPKMKMKDIAAELNVTPKTISTWKKEQEFRDEYDANFRIKLQYASAKAFKKQVDLLDSPNEMVAYLASKDIMDRAGYNPVEKVQQEVDMDLNITVDYGDDE